MKSKVLAEKQYKYNKPEADLGEGKFIGVLSTYRSMNIGTDCENIVNGIGETCQVHPEVEFVKLAIFGTHGGLKNSPTNCLSKLARECNQQIQSSIDICHETGHRSINFLQIDYPNYPGAGLKTAVEIAYDENLEKSNIPNEAQIIRNDAESQLLMSHKISLILINVCIHFF